MKQNIILHCSDSEFGNAAIITTWHIARQFRNIGYHFVILNGRITATCTLPVFDGHLETGRGLDEEGAHCKSHNDSFGICLIGKSGKFTSKQIEQCHNVIKMLKFKYDIGEVKQHSDYEPMKPFCAGFDEEMMGLFNK
jgi:N-acetylmuramoyl-L-alanine amidase